jgi:phenylalanyl-tRNA synthetase beta chain
MKVSYQGLKKYAPFNQHPEEIASMLTDLGLEVEEIETVEAVKGGLKGVVVGQVLEAVQHPNADRLRVCQVTLDGENQRQIVCGAPNVAAGQKVAVATEGTVIYLPDGTSFEIKKSKIRGEESNGMICAEDELGLGSDHAGIMVLPNDAPLGQPIATYLKLDSDFVFHIGLTPNRTDAMGHEGVARELAFIAGLPFESLKGALSIPSGASSITLQVVDNAICSVYSGLVIRGTKAIESPDWLKKALTALGLRPMNVLVDVTNYLLHQTGQPLHAFDLKTWIYKPSTLFAKMR